MKKKRNLIILFTLVFITTFLTISFLIAWLLKNKELAEILRIILISFIIITGFYMVHLETKLKERRRKYDI